MMYEPTEQELNEMYERYMKQFGETEYEQEYNYNMELVAK